jgi:hypothetical protein
MENMNPILKNVESENDREKDSRMDRIDKEMDDLRHNHNHK